MEVDDSSEGSVLPGIIAKQMHEGDASRTLNGNKRAAPWMSILSTLYETHMLTSFLFPCY